MAGPDWEETDPVEGTSPGDAPADIEGELARFPIDEEVPIWDEGVLTPSPGTPGEGGGEGEFLAEFASTTEMHPHPDPLPEYRERGAEEAARTPTASSDQSIFARLLADPYSFDFFQAVRRIEAERADLPSVGHSIRPNQDAVRFCQEPSLAFSPSTVWRYLPPGTNSPARLFVNFLGMLGPHGPLPLHLTDYARDRERNHSDPSMARFLDLFNHRIISLFFRAWASSSQAVSYERGTRANPPDAVTADRFGVYFASLFGLGQSSLRGRDAVADVAKLHFAGRLANQTRNAEGLRAIVQQFFGIDADIEEFVGRWIDVPHEYRCRLGESPQTCMLGGTIIVGGRSWDCQQKFRIRLGPMDLADYQRMLPGGDSIRRLIAWVKTYTCDEFDWDVRLILRAREVPRVCLGSMGQLGWTTWVRSTPAPRDGDDLILHPAA
jgi:type VI secretion system protein ImpH